MRIPIPNYLPSKSNECKFREYAHKKIYYHGHLNTLCTLHSAVLEVMYAWPLLQSVNRNGHQGFESALFVNWERICFRRDNAGGGGGGGGGGSDGDHKQHLTMFTAGIN